MLILGYVEQSTDFQSTNIHAKWLENLFENIVRLENHERLARTGFNSMQEYITLLTIHPDRANLMLIDIQYKNLCAMVGEIMTTLSELTEVMDADELEKLRMKAELINKHIYDRQKFIIDSFSSSRNRVINSQLTDTYYKTLEEVSAMRGHILTGLSSIRHVRKEGPGQLLRIQ